MNLHTMNTGRGRSPHSRLGLYLKHQWHEACPISTTLLDGDAYEVAMSALEILSLTLAWQ
jgi:hypothetical protein